MSEIEPDLGRMSQTVTDTLGALRLGPEHAAVAELARRLAGMLDATQDAATWARLSPRLLGVLRELGATPAPGGRPPTRSTPTGGDHDDDDHDDDGERELDELTERRRTRANRAADMDPAAPAPDP